jgi:predicted nucleotidyltransferase
MLSPKYTEKIKQIFAEKVKFAFLFGSALTEYFTAGSDIDIAIYAENYPLPPEYLTDLKYRAEKSINFEYDIDLLILNSADIIISNQIITTGKIIINNDKNFTENFISSRRGMYFDFKFFRKNLEENLKTKVL